MIINSLLDLDYYKLTMGQLAFKMFPDLVVKYKFFNRTNIDLAKYINVDQLIQEVQNVQDLKLSDQEINYLKSDGNFSDDYIDYLSQMRLPDVNIKANGDDRLEITTHGYWKDAILWETIILSIVNELYYLSRYQDKTKFIETGTQKNLLKFSTVSHNPNWLIADFGTRRRFSTQWQDDVVSIYKSLDNFMGTSNVKLAMKYDLQPIGTNAHEMYMIAGGLAEYWNLSIREAWLKMIDMWYDMYGYDLSIILTDTFGTKQFFEDFGKERAEKWKGVRHDSGDPFEFGDRVIEWYESMGIDPTEKTIIFSDGLTIDKIEKLHDYFDGRINFGFGWGTHLTNDMGAETLSIVMKAVKVMNDGENDIGTYLVKLSDNLNKSMGPKDVVEHYKQELGYDNTNRDTLKV